MKYDDLVLDAEKLEIRDIHGRPLGELRRKLFQLFRCLFQAAGDGRTHRQLLAEVWNDRLDAQAAELLLKSRRAKVHTAIAELRRAMQDWPVTIGVKFDKEDEAREGVYRLTGLTSAVADRKAWSKTSPEVRIVFSRATAIAQDLDHRHLGVEHLALALLDHEGGGDITRYVRARARLNAEALRRAGTALTPSLHSARPHSLEPKLTERLSRYLKGLNDGCCLEELWEKICQDLRQPLQHIGEGIRLFSGPRTLKKVENSTETAPAVGYEVIGGPEDGRQLRMEPGSTLGRWTPDRSGVYLLYRNTYYVDSAMSRQHLLWLGDGTIEVLAETLLLRRGEAHLLPSGTYHLDAGTQLLVGHGTRLWVLGATDIVTGGLDASA